MQRAALVQVPGGILCTCIRAERRAGRGLGLHRPNGPIQVRPPRPFWYVRCVKVGGGVRHNSFLPLRNVHLHSSPIHAVPTCRRP